MNKKEEEFEAQVQRGGRVTIPIAIRELKRIRVGGYVLVSVRKAEIKPVKEKEGSKQ